MNKYITTLLIHIFVVFSLFSCDCNTKKSIKPIVTFLYFDLAGEDVFVDTINTHLHISQVGDNVIFEYDGRYKETYCVNFSAYKGYKIYLNDTADLLYTEKQKIIMHPQNDTLDIYKFISNPFSIDGAHYLFFSPQLGIILKKSTTWTTYSILSEHFLIQKDFLANQLTSILLYKEYLAVSLEIPMKEPPPSPALK